MTQARTGDLFLHFDPQGPLLDATLDCERQVFAERYDFSPEQMREFYAPYEDASTFLALTQTDGDVVAMARYVFPNPNGLVTTRELGEEPWSLDGPRLVAATGLDPAHTWDVATLAVRNGGRRVGVMQAAAMYHGLIRASRANDIRGFTAMMDERVRRLLGMFGLLVRDIPGAGTAAYGASPATTPVFQLTSDFIGGQRRSAPDAHRLVTLGIGLDGIHVPDDEAFTLRRPRAAPERQTISVVSVEDRLARADRVSS